MFPCEMLLEIDSLVFEFSSLQIANEALVAHVRILQIIKSMRFFDFLERLTNVYLNLPFACLFSLSSPKVSMIIPKRIFSMIMIIMIMNERSKKNRET